MTNRSASRFHLKALLPVLVVLFPALLVGCLGNEEGEFGDIEFGPQVVVDRATIVTSEGDIVIELIDESLAPITVNNFKRYVEAGFYSGLIFHRVVDGFVIQGGGYFEDLSPRAPLFNAIALEASNEIPHRDGAIAMARTDAENSATSQFYITDGAQPSLDGKYAVFGYVTNGMDVVRDIAAQPVRNGGPGFDKLPINTVTIERITLG